MAVKLLFAQIYVAHVFMLFFSLDLSHLPGIKLILHCTQCLTAAVVKVTHYVS